MALQAFLVFVIISEAAKVWQLAGNKDNTYPPVGDRYLSSQTYIFLELKVRMSCNLIQYSYLFVLQIIEIDKIFTFPILAIIVNIFKLFIL